MMHIKFFSLFQILQFGARFGNEFLKENQEAFENSLPLNMGQLLSLPLPGTGIWLLLLKLRATRQKMQSGQEQEL